MLGLFFVLLSAWAFDKGYFGLAFAGGALGLVWIGAVLSELLRES